MKIKYILCSFIVLLLCSTVKAQHILPATKETLEKLEQFQLHNQSAEAIKVLDAGIKSTTSPADLAYLYAYQSTIYAAMDSLLTAKRLIDLSMENARKSKSNVIGCSIPSQSLPE